MGGKTGIEWTEETWNPLVGCTAVSEGCSNCYAISMANRVQGAARKTGKPAYYEGLVRRSGGRTVWTGRVNMASRDVIEEPLRWRKPKLVFVNSMSDLFHEAVCDEDIMDIMAVMMQAKRHTFQVLTKRPHRMNELSYIGALARDSEMRTYGNSDQTLHPLRGADMSTHVWFGVSIESAEHLDRITPLTAMQRGPRSIRFLSLEPLLGPLTNLPLDGIDWVIAGGESGPRYRPVEADWLRDIRDQCIAAGVPFFFKQWGGRTPKKAGRMLDGHTWDEMPERGLS